MLKAFVVASALVCIVYAAVVCDDLKNKVACDDANQVDGPVRKFRKLLLVGSVIGVSPLLCLRFA